MWLNCWMFAVWLIPLISVGYCSWGAPGDGQYHIQTDEGPERYFRFQTDNGQFRKEKRLQDGTVIGTEAWIDAAGFLRQKDYIADKAGYRILKSKTIFVGHGTHIEEAIKSTKNAPAQSGVLVDNKHGLNSVTHANNVKPHVGYVYSTTTTTPLPPISSSIASNLIAAAAAEDAAGKLNYLSPAEAAKLEPTPHLGFDHYPDELPRLRQNLPHVLAHEPIVHIRPHSEPIDTHSNSIAEDDEDEGDYAHAIGTTTYHPPLEPRPSTPSLSMQPPFETRRKGVRPIALHNTRPSPISAESPEGYGYSTPAPFLDTSPHTPTREGYYYQHAPTAATHEQGYAHSTPRPDLALAVNNLEEGGLLPPLPRPTRRRLRPTHTHDDAGYTDYNGVSSTRGGFRYFLPRHYHEEETFDEDKRAGSYGYVDPFGIRRVVYYNASPGRGFVHRNNNRYVGLGATPYDPVVTL